MKEVLDIQQTVVAVGVHGIVSHGGFGWEVRKALTDERKICKTGCGEP